MSFNPSQFLSPMPAPLRRIEPDWYDHIAGVGEAIGESRQRHDAAALQQSELNRLQARDASNEEHLRTGESQRERELSMTDKRQGQREDLYATQENRREEQAKFERQQHLGGAWAEYYKELAAAKTPWEQEAAAQTLQKRLPPGVTLEAPNAETVPQAPQVEQAPAAAPAKAPLPGQGLPMKGKDAALSRELAADEAKFMAAMGAPAAPPAPPPPPPPVARYLPGQAVTQASQFLSPGDPYNFIR